MTEVASFYAYTTRRSQGGVRVAAADVTGDGVAEIITGAGPGGGPHVVVWDLSGGGLTTLASFYAYQPGYCDIGTTTPDPMVCDGVYVAAGDVNGDGLAEVITGTNRQGGPLRVFQVGAGVTELTSFYPYLEAFRGPVRVAAVDLNRGVKHGTLAADLIPPAKVARDVPASAGQAPLARAGWLQSTVAQRLHYARRARAPP